MTDTRNMNFPFCEISWLSMSFSGDKTDMFNVAAPLTERTIEQQSVVCLMFCNRTLWTSGKLTERNTVQDGDICMSFIKLYEWVEWF